MIDAATRRLVHERAGHRCEYCGMLQAQQSFPFFHVDHIIAQQHGGTDDPANPAFWFLMSHIVKKGLDL